MIFFFFAGKLALIALALTISCHNRDGTEEEMRRI
jgi:hypothetical protein